MTIRHFVHRHTRFSKGCPFFCAIALPTPNCYFVPIEKNACTTIKSNIFFALNNREYVGDIHRYWDSRADCFHFWWVSLETFALVRDPLTRFISGYRDLVLHRNEGRALFPNQEPDVEYFLANFNSFLQIPMFKSHFQMQAEYLRPNTKLYRFNEIKKFQNDFGLRISNPSNVSKKVEIKTNEMKLIKSFIEKKYKKDINIFETIKSK